MTTPRASEQLGALLSAHPLPSEFGSPEMFADRTSINGVSIGIVGLALDVHGECITGSAGSLAELPLERAYFELLERLAVVTTMAAVVTPLQVRDDSGCALRFEPVDALFPMKPPSASNRWARSNGVALGATWKDAAERARLELVERDRILRSWYGELTPLRIEEPRGVVPDGLKRSHRLAWYEFGTEPDSVVGLFGFPESGSPFVHGFGAGRDRASAARSAAREWLQRLAFLWGEAIPVEQPTAAPSPDFHQEHYLYEGHLQRVQAWLRGDHVSFSGVLRAPRRAEEVRYVELTPPWLRSGLHVVKAVSRERVPLCFGLGHPWVPACPQELMVHPIV